MSIYRDYSEKLKSMLELRGSPIAVIYTDIPADDAMEGKCWACYGLIDASNGKTIDMSARTSACGGGMGSLGLAPRPMGKPGQPLKNFLVKGEKLCATEGTFWRMLANNSQPPLGLAEHVIYKPLEKCDADPELVVFIVTPRQAARLGQLLVFHDGIPIRPELGGATCHQVIGYPLTSGLPAIALGDWTNRSPDNFKYDEMFVTIPWHRMGNVMDAIPRCTAGDAKMAKTPGFEGEAG